MNDLIQIGSSLIVGGVGYKFLALAYTNKFKSKDLQMDIIGELRAEVKEYADYLRLIEVTNTRLEKEKTRLEAKNALLDKLGITEEEAKLLLS
jgi:hypothetical protein